jgi:CRISPR/Cas system-associated exonuclease Cas4 (RecB family)
MIDGDLVKAIYSGKYDKMIIKDFREMFEQIKADERNMRHKYEPHPIYPWFCKHCGYAEHEDLMHY